VVDIAVRSECEEMIRARCDGSELVGRVEYWNRKVLMDEWGEKKRWPFSVCVEYISQILRIKMIYINHEL
jgi:hypothetical protein